MKLSSAFLVVSSAQTDYDYSTVAPTTTTSLGSSWNPFKCSGDCGCCCKPENRPHCDDGIWMSNAWQCSSGDYLLWEGVQSWKELAGVGIGIGDNVKSVGECRSMCDQFSWCNGFQFDSTTDDGTKSCTIVDNMTANMRINPVAGLIAGMKCDHIPVETPDEDPSGHLWSSCRSHYERPLGDDEVFMTGAFVPTCKADGSWEEMQCWASTGHCWCVNEFGEKIAGSEKKGPVKCDDGKDKNVKKVERLSSELNQILEDNIKKAAQLTKTVSKMADKTVTYYENNKKRCNFGPSNDSDAESARYVQGNACGEVKKRFSRWMTWIDIYNVCNDQRDGCKKCKGRFAGRMKKLLSKIQTKSNRRLNCE